MAILGNSESLGLLTYDACLSEGLNPPTPVDLTTRATPDDFSAALGRALAERGDCDAVIVTAIPSLGERAAVDQELAEALRAAVGAPGAQTGLTGVLRGTPASSANHRPRGQPRRPRTPQAPGWPPSSGASAL